MKISVIFVAAVSVATASFARFAAAEEQFDVKAEPGQVAVVTKGHWHVNKDYPWKATVGDVAMDRSKFVFTETSAKVAGLPHGTARLKGAVCDGPQCVPFTKEIVVP